MYSNMFGILKTVIPFGLNANYDIIFARKSDVYTKTEIDVLLSAIDDIKTHVNIYSDLPTTFYDSPSNLKPVLINDLAYVNNPSSGLFGIVNRKPAGTYKFDGTSWIVSYDYSSIIAAINDAKLTWSYYLNTWTTIPTLIASLTNGKVYSYINGGVTTYRYVPNTYDPAQDAFYSNFNGTNLTNKIVSRA